MTTKEEMIKELKNIWLSYPNNTECLNKIRDYLVKMEKDQVLLKIEDVDNR